MARDRRRLVGQAKNSAQSNGGGDVNRVTLQIALWAIQAVFVGAFWFLYTTSNGLKTDMLTLEAKQSAKIAGIELRQENRSEQLIRLDAGVSRLTTDVVEIRASMRTIEGLMTEQRLLMEKYRPK